MHDALGDRVDVWTTLNEPWCSSFLSYTAGIHAPGHYSQAEGMLAAHHLLLGHGQTVRELRARDSSLNLGLTLNLTVADPVDPANPADLDAARRIDGQFNRWFLDPVFRGEYPADIIKDFRTTDAEAVARWQEAVQPGDLDVISTPIDSLGVNYYHGEFVGGTAPEVDPPAGDAPTPRPVGKPFPAHENLYWHDRGLARTNMHWEVQPEGLTRLLERVSEDYSADAGVALYVTENGASYDDELVTDGGEPRVHDVERVVEFVEAHLGAVLDAVDRASTCAATSTGRSWTTSSGPGATRSASASSTSTTPRRSGRSRTRGSRTRGSSPTAHWSRRPSADGHLVRGRSRNGPYATHNAPQKPHAPLPGMRVLLRAPWRVQTGRWSMSGAAPRCVRRRTGDGVEHGVSDVAEPGITARPCGGVGEQLALDIAPIQCRRSAISFCHDPTPPLRAPAMPALRDVRWSAVAER